MEHFSVKIINKIEEIRKGANFTALYIIPHITKSRIEVKEGILNNY